MATFSTNQTRQLYVVTGNNPIVVATNPTDLYFKYTSPDGAVRSDIIPKANITQLKAIYNGHLMRQLTKYKVALDANVNGGAPVSGQEYLTRITFFEWGSLSPEDQYLKYGVVKATTGMTATQFYAAMAASITANMSREQIPLLTVTSDANGVYLLEIEQPWTLGTKESRPLMFKVHVDTIIDTNGDEQVWGVVTEPASGSYIVNGKTAADMEYFYMGERGDIYRNIGFPNVLKTNYLTDPTGSYDFLEIDYFYVGDGVDAQKSQKHITIIGNANEDSYIFNVVSDLFNNGIQNVEGVVYTTDENGVKNGVDILA